ncbi:MMS19 nucleotide excision repair protein homolog isoform X1 [Ananas comosus]|uniref:MMS19 nucleotide excision repair protein n=2 Tax=Ananas comosus TaxID=4615 RepID=A0A6P5GAS3_ANACO|nr:MMS19 nucleotide excision repair protein homolog isoform X1 [Ananas comosus]XP_020105716.1 MMS19 nucleotide excision repair protein homolog isoform X1 [Ananas comosus]XP_020105717.1 MMS19 nucleotide excision repair protein homolog isoform X1 [Ananas comosus]XP_020105718.1 MMS19 nucleotide excision repair protein homolog isoform X1 [Ananas comosus]XP_020105719.1 MMS19 nucleotide excision repair protein homolog isoform X1 [Ananas comosus]
MANPSSWTPHVEAFVDTSRPPSEHVASIEATTKLVNNDLLSLLDLVKEMEMYLTTSDHVIRSRGILFLAEVLARITSKPLDSVSVSCLAEFFTSRLSDWQALRGALVGCLALLRRKGSLGTIAISNARKLAQSFFMYVQVQSLTVNDRKLSFEVLHCLLEEYPDAVVVLGDELLYGICEAVDEEKDPDCLMLSFQLVEIVIRLFPDPSDLVTRFAGDIFEILSKYFPVYFTHGGGDELHATRDDLSRALMNAFCSTPNFEPFAIPLLLDKLSSSLQSAKLDSLKYLTNCLRCYGADRMLKHSKAIWLNLKDVIFSFPPQRPLVLTTESSQDTERVEHQIGKEALSCLQTAMLCLTSPDKDVFINLILEDEDVVKRFGFVLNEGYSVGTSVDIHGQLNALGSIFSTISKSSTYFCTRVFQKYFPCLLDFLGVSRSGASYSIEMNNVNFPGRVNNAALYLCNDILSACKELTLDSLVFSQDILEQDTWWHVLKRFSDSLSYFAGSLVTTCNEAANSQIQQAVTHSKIQQESILYSMKVLQTLATFPEHYSPISESVYHDILLMLISVVTCKYDDVYLWNLSLKTLGQIGSSIEDIHDSAKGTIYSRTVVERAISLLQVDDTALPLSLKLDVVSEIGAIALDPMSRVLKALEEAIVFHISKACVDGRTESAETAICLLECYSCKLLPRFCTLQDFDEVLVLFAIRLWEQMESLVASKNEIKVQGLLDSLMMTMKLLVASCSEEQQSLIVKRAYTIVSAVKCLPLQPFSPSSKLEELRISPGFSIHNWLVSLFASVVIALRPQTTLPDVDILLNMFIVFLLEGQLPAAQALASILNKWPSNGNISELSSVYTFDQAIDLVLEKCFTVLSSSSFLANFYSSNDSKINAIAGLAWVGKGLLMRGHEKVKEITMFFLKCLLSSQNSEIMQLNQKELDARSLLATSAADAFQLIMSDSDVCLSKQFHATTKPLYKQRFFSSLIPVLLSSVKEYATMNTNYRTVLYRAFGHLISNTPLAAVVAESHKIVPTLVDCLGILSLNTQNKDLIYSLLLVLSGILMDKNGKEHITENIHLVINLLAKLVLYPHMMLVRETALQCLVAMSGLPHSRIYPMRLQVLRAVTKALDDKKWAVRQEAVRCRQAWASIA